MQAISNFQHGRPMNRIRTAICLAVALVSLSACADELSPGLRLSYRGHIARQAREAENQVEKTFEIEFIVAERKPDSTRLVWLLSESGRGRWTWADRSGSWTLDRDLASAAGDAPALLYDRDGHDEILALFCPLLAAPAELKPETTWNVGKSRYVVAASEPTGGREAWRIEQSNDYGRKATLWLDQAKPVIAKISQRVFMGQGEEYELAAELVSAEPLTSAELDSLVADAERFAALRESIGRAPRDPAPNLTAAQTKKLRQALPEVESGVRIPFFQELARATRADLDEQGALSDKLAGLEKEQLGRAVDDFALSPARGREPIHVATRGAVTVLHFWEYRDEPLKEPYGQVGYLDFLAGKRAADGVRVFGIAVDARFADEATRATALRGVHRLLEFMSLSYPVLLDDGALLKQFGDPRQLGATLPLFVVIGPDGKIAHYYVGHYEVDRNAGLKALDAQVTRALESRTP